MSQEADAENPVVSCPLLNIAKTDEQFEKTRKCLLNQYHSNALTHSGYIIAIVIGTLTLISRWDAFFPNQNNLNLPAYFGIVFYALIDIIVALSFYVVKRLLYWTALSSCVLAATKVKAIGKARECYAKDCIDKKKPAGTMPEIWTLSHGITKMLEQADSKGTPSYQKLARISFAKTIGICLIIFVVTFVTLWFAADILTFVLKGLSY